MIVKFWNDGTGRAYMVELVRHAGSVEMRNIYRELFRGAERFTVYRESCHGKLPNVAKERCLDAVSEYMLASA